MPWLILIGVAFFFMVGVKKAYAYSKGDPIEIELGSIGSGYVLRKDAAGAFNAMRLEAAKQGVFLVVESAFRTMEQQTSLWERWKLGTGNLAATPGFSNHQSGIAVDIKVDRSFDSREYNWLSLNARRFGFVNTGATFSQKEPWHWEYLR